jgi:hypothetical protein
MALQQKKIETRSWPTNYRGEIVIHAAKGFPKWAKELCSEEPFAASLNYGAADTLPLSRGLCIVRIVDCIRTEQVSKIASVAGSLSVKEFEFGDYGEGRYAWVTEYVRPLNDDRIVRGALGLWDWPEVSE